MTVIATREWIVQDHDNPTKLCARLQPYFNEANANEIHRFLMRHGMYERSNDNILKLVEEMQKRKIWEIIMNEERNLRKEWDGPDIPIFIFPANSTDRRLKRDYNGKSGLAFHDKLFLFLSNQNVDLEIRALFLHEYNHIVRLANIKKDKKPVSLLDAVILEGLAEYAVLEILGEEYNATWTKYYSNEVLARYYKKFIKPHTHILTENKRYTQLLYGSGVYPHMLGYCVGYYLVHQYAEKNGLNSKELLLISSEEIVSSME